MEKVLIVDDDLQFLEQLKAAMVPHGWHADLATSGNDALSLLNEKVFDLVLLDWNLPDMTGAEICERFRESGKETPIIYLTNSNAIEDKESGLDAGGDDFITKPLDIRELLARVRTIKRRCQSSNQGSLRLRDIRLDPRLRALSVGEKVTRLSLTECTILEFLLRNRNCFFSSSQLVETLWPEDSKVSNQTVRMFVMYLRRKLEEAGAPNLIETVAGSGYIVRDGNTTT